MNSSTRRGASAAVLALALLALIFEVLARRADGRLRLEEILTGVGGALLAGAGTFPPSSSERLRGALRIGASALLFARLCATIAKVIL